jgi:hypothetical protein
MRSNRERNEQIVQMRKNNVARRDVALRFRLSVWSVRLIEERAKAETLAVQRRDRMLEKIREVDDLDAVWPAYDLIDAIGLITTARERLLHHFAEARKQQISLRVVMDMAFLDNADGEVYLMNSPLLEIRGVGKKGFWSLANRLTATDMGKRCNQEWQTRLAKVKERWEITGSTPWSGG